MQSINVRGSWEEDIQKLSVLLLVLFQKAKIVLISKFEEKNFCSMTSVVTVPGLRKPSLWHPVLDDRWRPVPGMEGTTKNAKNDASSHCLAKWSAWEHHRSKCLSWSRGVRSKWVNTYKGWRQGLAGHDKHLVSVSCRGLTSTSFQAWHLVPHKLSGRWPQLPYAAVVSERLREVKSLA